MGFPGNCCTISIDPLQASFTPKSTAMCTAAASDDGELDDHEVKFESLLYRMIWGFGLGCAIPRRRRPVKVENNKAWLLAESGGCGGDEAPYSGHSSFRFSLCSQVELESAMAVNKTSSATVLMVNLDSGLLADSSSKSRELKWKRLESLERSISPVTNALIRFSYSEIVTATRSFSKGRVLGRGALSCVFRGRVGFLRTAVAIKRLDKEDKECCKAFCRELMIASSLHNPHIVPLLGFCIDADEGLFLVYRFVSGGSLDQYLHGKARGAVAVLPWSARCVVAMGIAEAIEYLHNGTERCVVHRDIKPSNILLSSKKTPKLCDFGLATWTPAPSVPFLCKTVKGTFGYLAPEYFQHGKVSDKTDIYAFGVVLLELLTGRKPIESRRGPGQENLVQWAKPLLQQGSLDKILDPRLKYTPKNMDQVARMVQAAAACVHNEELRRPAMGEVMTLLRGKEEWGRLRRKKASIGVPGNGAGMIDSCPQLQRTRSEMKNHFALAMVGVEFEEDDHLRCR